MPRNVRNFWLEATIDGRRSTIGTGPVRRDGGFFLTIRQRDDGGIVTAAVVEGLATTDGRLVLRLVRSSDNEMLEVQTKR